MIQYQVIKKIFLPERFNEVLLKKTDLTMKENDNVKEKLNIT